MVKKPNFIYSVNQIKKRIAFYFSEKMGLNIRPSTFFMKDYFQEKKIIGAEIGVFKGQNAKTLLKNLNIEKLYLIDSYEKMLIKKEDILPSLYTLPSELLDSKTQSPDVIIDWEKCFPIAQKNPF